MDEEEEEEEEDPMMLSLEDIPELDLSTDNDEYATIDEMFDSDDTVLETDLERMIRHVLYSKRDLTLQVVTATIKEMSALYRPLNERFFNFLTNDSSALGNIEKDTIQVVMHLRRVFTTKQLPLFEFTTPVKDPMLCFTKMLLSRCCTFINLEDEVYKMVTSRSTASQYRFGDDKSFGVEYVKQERYYEYEGFFLLAVLSKDPYSCGYCFDKLRNLYPDELLNRVQPVVREIIHPTETTSKRKKKKVNT